MKYIALTLLLQLLLCTSGRAQSEWGEIRIPSNRNTVVATGGLNLRSAPGTHGKIVVKLPYSTKVEVLEEKLHNPDTVNHKYEWVQPYGWAKVRAGRDTGYLYDAYLYYNVPSPLLSPQDDWPEGINTKYRVITNQGDATENYDVFSYKWYGLYHEAINCNVQYVKPSFSYFAGEVEESLDMVANTEAQPTFFIGSPKTLGTGFRIGWIKPLGSGTEEDQKASETVCAANGIAVKPVETSYWASANEFTLKVGDVTQHLSPGGRAGAALYLEAAADFDGDGRNDFIISYDIKGWDSSIMYVLFLSSEARPNELVRPVAMHYTYHGC